MKLHLVIGLIVEDRRFRDFLEPAIRKIAGRASARLAPFRQACTHGCRTRVLSRDYESLCQECDLVIVAADALGQRHVRRARSHRQKARALRRVLPSRDPKLMPAIAQPSVEAWLMCDPGAFGRGLQEGTGLPFRTPAQWPAPRTERDAKAELGNIVALGLGSPLPRSGFEYAREVVGHMDLEAAPNPSLAEWARDLASRMRRRG